MYISDCHGQSYFTISYFVCKINEDLRAGGTFQAPPDCV